MPEKKVEKEKRRKYGYLTPKERWYKRLDEADVPKYRDWENGEEKKVKRKLEE